MTRDAQGLSQYVTCFYEDAYANGFARLPQKVDAVFLDLPKPWYQCPPLRPPPPPLRNADAGCAACLQKKR
jgi:hypothetical protein